MTTNSYETQQTGEQLRDAGVAAVLNADEAVHRGYRKHIEAVMDELVDAGRPFCADDVQRALTEDVRRYCPPNLLPAIFSAYRNSRRIQQVGWSTSTRPARHAGALRQWIGSETPDSPGVPEQRRVRSGETPTKTPSSNGVQLPLI